MANIKAPAVVVSFHEAAASTINRGNRGTLAMIIVDPIAESQADYTLYDTTDIPAAASDASKTAMTLALTGYVTMPKKVLVHAILNTDEGEKYADALEYFGRQSWNVLVAPTAEADNATATIANWIKAKRDEGLSYRAVLSNTAADDPAIVNVCSTAVYDGSEISAGLVACRIAGVICGTPLAMSCTYAPLYDFTDCQRLSKEDLDAAVAAGKLVLMWDGEKVKICRGVTSFTTTNTEEGDSFKKIKLVDAMDMMRDEIIRTIEDSYIGKYENTYDNKCVLIAAVNSYFRDLAAEKVIDSGRCDINLEAHRAYFKAHGGKLVVDGESIALEDATDIQIRKGNTGSAVLLTATVSLLDAIEDVSLDIFLG